MKVMPQLGSKCVARFNEDLKIAATTEGLWLGAPPASEIKKQLKVGQLEALYEATFLRVFASFESFLEDSLAHFMAGYATPNHSPSPAAGTALHATVTAALGALYGNRSYLLWHDVGRDIGRAKTHLLNCPLETILAANKVQLDDYASIRHHIAHNSKDSRQKFEAAARRITGSTHGGKPGRMLRSEDISDPLNTPKWIRKVVDDMAGVVLQICP